ncbi:MAG: hypothetical protein IJ105_03970 [Bacilli bacterium]|nr:hypothetical protein [Bacilli bacterium]
MNISKDSLKKIKEELFNKNISEEEKDIIIKKINQEIEELISKLNPESDPIDE